MGRNLLAVLGALFVLGLVGAAVVGLMVVKDRIRIVVHADETAAGPDPIALLRDDVQILQRELSELRTALPTNFEQLGSALDERAAGRHTELEKGVEKIAAMVTELRRSLESQEEGLKALRQEVATSSVDPTPIAAMAATTTPIAESAKAPEEIIAAQEPPVSAAPKRTGFLSFSVPTTRYEFDAPHVYVLLPQLSRVGFDAKSTLHNFTGVTSSVEGQFRADFDDPEGAWRGEVSCAASTLITGLEERDTNMREHLDTEHHKDIRFEIEQFVANEVSVAQQTANGTIVGTMTIRGKSQKIRMPVKVSVDNSKRVVIEGQAPLKLSDFEVPIPSQLGGAIQMEDEVSVWVALRARPQLGSSK